MFKISLSLLRTCPIETHALLAAIVVGVLTRKWRVSFLLTLSAVMCLIAAQVVWQLHNGPVNQAVDPWTVATMPSNWMTSRDPWEYAHATRAGLHTYLRFAAPGATF